MALPLVILIINLIAIYSKMDQPHCRMCLKSHPAQKREEKASLINIRNDLDKLKHRLLLKKLIG